MHHHWLLYPILIFFSLKEALSIFFCSCYANKDTSVEFVSSCILVEKNKDSQLWYFKVNCMNMGGFLKHMSRGAM